MTAPKAPSSDHQPSASASLAPDFLRSKLTAASKDDLVGLIERLAADSAEVSARLDYLTDPDAAAKALQGRIRAIRVFLPSRLRAISARLIRLPGGVHKPGFSFRGEGKRLTCIAMPYMQ